MPTIITATTITTTLKKKKALTTTKRKQHESIQEEELDDIEDHAAERNLQRSEVRVDAEDVDQFEEAAKTNDVC